ncbi:MAG: response regulator [Balneolia bacterium]|nr:response regulator [Balneolia bacterium]
MTKKNQTVLLVEDEMSMQTLFGFALKKAGFEVLNANNGKDALEVLSKVRPDAIISDIMMPELDGFEFREILKMSEDLYEIPFLFLSAFNNENNIIKGIGLDADDFIPKTDGALVVVNKLQNVLRKREQFESKVLGEAAKVSATLRGQGAAPEVKGFEIAMFSRNNEGLPGGEFIDFTKIGDNLLTVVGDVDGKKWEAWVYAQAYAAYVRSTIRSFTSANGNGSDIETSTILNELNSLVYDDEQVSQAHCSLALMLLDPKKSNLTVTNTLKYPLMLYRALTQQVIDIQPDEKNILGAKPESTFIDVNFKLEKGDAILTFCDGLSEALAKKGKAESFEILKSAVETNFIKEEYSLDAVLDSFIRKSNIVDLKDDVTLTMIRKI